MRLVFFAVLLVGISLAGLAAVMAKDYIGAYESALAEERAARPEIVPLTDVFVATRALRYGEPLSKDDVRPVRWPAESVPEGAFGDGTALFPEGEALRIVTRSMEAGEAILAVKVTEPGEEAGVSSRLPRGMRAFAISVDVASGVSGFLRPGDRVDVFWSGRIARGDGIDREVTKLIESNVRLVAVDQLADVDQAGPVVARTVTVEATPEQVAALAQAQSTGRLSLALLGASDDTFAEAVEIDQRELLGIEDKRTAAVAPKTCSIRTRKGAEVIDMPIPCRD